MSFERFDQSISKTSEFDARVVKRELLLDELRKSRHWDLIIVGGGIHGALFAHLAALNGLSTLLVEKNDYASATSSRSSKMAHGGLRYLEMFDIQQVLEGVKAREELYEVAGHLVQPHEFFIPVPKDESWLRLKLQFGLGLYDWFIKGTDRKHRWVSESDLDAVVGECRLNRELQGGFLYSDGLMNDTRLVMENIAAARQEGAVCLNYMNFKSYQETKSGKVSAGCTDKLTGEQFELSAGIVVNCGGPWVPYVGRVKKSGLVSRIRYSQGTHLLFNRKWEGPARFLPLEEKGRYYFVWPHFAGTLVGTTEREVSELAEDPQPTSGEVAEILQRLERDLPNSGLNKENLHYCFAGIRTLPLRKSTGAKVSKISRKHVWVHQNGMLSLLGGKFTTAAWTAYEGLCKVYKLAGLKQKPTSTAGRKLPGAGLYDESVKSFLQRAQECGIADDTASKTVSRLGSQVRYLVEEDENLEEVCPGLLRQEVKYAISVEQAETLEDIMRRRLLLEFYPGYGKEALSSICKMLAAKDPKRDYESEKNAYLSRLENLQSLMQGVGE